jgi:hypothetical protein
MRRRPALVVFAVLSNLAPALALAQSVGMNPSAAPSDIRSPSSTNPAAAASDIRNPSSNNPAAAASDLRDSRAVAPAVSPANRSGSNGSVGAVKRRTGVDAQRKPKQHAAQPKTSPPLGEPAASRTSDRALPKSCEDRATDKELSADAKAAFIIDCRKESAQPENAASSPPRTNAQSSQLQDQQFQKWDAAARRAMGSICVGCDRPVRVGRSPTRQAPVADRDDFEPE